MRNKRINYLSRALRTYTHVLDFVRVNPCLVGRQLVTGYTFPSLYKSPALHVDVVVLFHFYGVASNSFINSKGVDE